MEADAWEAVTGDIQRELAIGLRDSALMRLAGACSLSLFGFLLRMVKQIVNFFVEMFKVSAAVSRPSTRLPTTSSSACVMIPHMSAGAQPGLTPKPDPPRPRAKPVDPAQKYWWAAAVAVPVLVAIIAIIPSFLKKESPSVKISQDSHDLNFQPVTVIEREYQEKNGKALPPDVEQQIEQALQLLRQKRYEDGIPLLQAAAVKAPVPSVLTDLGHALATAGKSNAAQAAYTQAASLDPSNQQVSDGRKFLAKLTENITISAVAGSRDPPAEGYCGNAARRRHGLF